MVTTAPVAPFTSTGCRVTVPAFRDFQAALPGWVAEAPVVEQLTPVGSYRLF